MSYNVMLESLIKDIGGCGKFQWILSIILHLSKTVAAWSMLQMTFNGQEPKFFCTNNVGDENGTFFDSNHNASARTCSAVNGTQCTGFRYDDEMHTVVSEWGLVCDQAWMVATITTIQMGGVLVGCFVAGHLGDWIGRKPTYFLSILTLVVLNIVAYFSVSWEMYAAVRFILGLGIGFFLTVIYNPILEFTTNAWRPRVMAIPSWAAESSAFALVAWVFKDWKNIHLTTAIVGAPILLSWWYVQESFRWLVTKGRFKDAEAIVNKVAKINGRQKPDLTDIINQVKREETEEKRKYSALDLFKTKESFIKTLALLFIWFGVSYAYYGLTFGVQFMKGDLYLNMFIVNIVEVPAEFAAIYMMNRFGRKRTCTGGLFFTGLCGIADGVLQYVDTPAKGALINTFAIGSRMGVAVGWGTLAVMTMELYPTVVRTTAYGVANTSARVGGMIAPQIVFLNDRVPGLLFFLSGAIMIIASLLCFIFSETKGLVLEDALKKHDVKKDDIKLQVSTVENGAAVVDTKTLADNLNNEVTVNNAADINGAITAKF